MDQGWRVEASAFTNSQGGASRLDSVCQRMYLRSAYVSTGLRLFVTGRRLRAWAFLQRVRALLWRLSPAGLGREFWTAQGGRVQASTGGSPRCTMDNACRVYTSHQQCNAKGGFFA